MSKNKYPKRIIVKMVSLFIILSLTLISLCSCGLQANNPGIKIINQPSGQTAGDVTISVEVSNFKLGAADGNSNTTGGGHIIYYMDTPVPTYYKHEAFSKAGTYVISEETQYTWKSVSPGDHTFAVQLVDADNSPLPSPVVDSITINAAPPNGAPILKILSPADGSSLSPGNLLLSINVENFIVSQENMGVFNRNGEGHLIYYIDETPPAEAGVPANTDTSKVSAELSHLWKEVKEGRHTLSVQLVNNDDTPLETPVVVSISIDVAS
jgi:hypothetical protein